MYIHRTIKIYVIKTNTQTHKKVLQYFLIVMKNSKTIIKNHENGVTTNWDKYSHWNKDHGKFEIKSIKYENNHYLKIKLF